MTKNWKVGDPCHVVAETLLPTEICEVRNRLKGR